MVLMIDNPQPSTVNLGAILFPCFMGTFDYPSPSNDVRFILVVPDHSKATIFQVSSFKTSYFHDPWNLPSPSTSMEGVGNLGMAMPLSTAEVVYSVVKKASTNPDLAPPHELDLVLKPIWAQYSLTAQDPLELVFPFNEAILEEMTGPDRPWDDLHHRSYFLPELRRIEACRVCYDHEWRYPLSY
jgi:hypothetical protein